jgi:hypothetical protein
LSKINNLISFVLKGNAEELTPPYGHPSARGEYHSCI